MRRRAIGLGLVVVFAIGIEASSASAAPVFYTKAVVGSKAAAVPFTGTAGALFYEPANLNKYVCTGGTAAGEVTGPTTVTNYSETFTGCSGSELPCNSTGEASGVIKLKTLEGSLGNVTTSLPGLRLFSQSEGKGGVFAEFTCGGGAIAEVWRGSIIGSLSGASGTEAANGKFGTSNKLTFAETKGTQKYSKFLAGEGEAGTEQLESSTNRAPFEKLGWSVIDAFKSTPASNLGFTK